MSSLSRLFPLSEICGREKVLTLIKTDKDRKIVTIYFLTRCAIVVYGKLNRIPEVIQILSIKWINSSKSDPKFSHTLT